VALGRGAAVAAVVAGFAVAGRITASTIGGAGHPGIYAVLIASGSAVIVLPVVQERRLVGRPVLTVMAQVTVADVAATLVVPIVLSPSHAGWELLGAGASSGCAQHGGTPTCSLHHAPAAGGRAARYRPAGDPGGDRRARAARACHHSSPGRRDPSCGPHQRRDVRRWCGAARAALPGRSPARWRRGLARGALVSGFALRSNARGCPWSARRSVTGASSCGRWVSALPCFSSSGIMRTAEERLGISADARGDDRVSAAGCPVVVGISRA
jgi:hypothetical protein